jgi:CRP-like cAMP-binding protein
MTRSDSDAAPRAANPRRNILLGSLPESEYARLAPALEPVILPRPTELEARGSDIEFVYFPTSGVASIVAVAMDGETVDTTMIGREGMTGLAVFLGTNQMPVPTMVQILRTAFRLPADALRAELEQGGMLVNLLLRYTQVVMVSMLSSSSATGHTAWTNGRPPGSCRSMSASMKHGSR